MEGGLIAKEKPITIWSILALLTLVLLGGGTWLMSQQALSGWATSGDQYELEIRHPLDLEVGTYPVYYESPRSVPRASGVVLTLINKTFNESSDAIQRVDGEQVEKEEFNLGGRQGRMLWTFDITEAGPYELRAVNTDVADVSQVAADRIVLNKSPGRLSEAMSGRTMILLVGMSITIVLVITFYIIHVVALSKK